MGNERRKRLLPQILLGAVGITALIWWSGAAAVVDALRSVALSWFGAALGLYLVGQGLCAWKWAHLADGLGFRQSPDFFLRIYLGAMFPSLFLPTSIGGDVFRIVLLARTAQGTDPTGDRTGAAISVLADRGTGALALSLLAAVSIALTPWFSGLPLAWMVIGAAIGLLIGFLIPFAYRPRFPPGSFPGRVLQLWEQPRLLFFALTVSLLFQGLDCTAHWLLGCALHLEVSPLFYFILCPLTSVAAMSPITRQGLGERSAATVLLFSLAGVSAAPAVAFGLTWTAMSACAAFIGGAIFLSGGNGVYAGAEADA